MTHLVQLSNHALLHGQLQNARRRLFEERPDVAKNPELHIRMLEQLSQFVFTSLNITKAAKALGFVYFAASGHVSCCAFAVRDRTLAQRHGAAHDKRNSRHAAGRGEAARAQTPTEHVGRGKGGDGDYQRRGAHGQAAQAGGRRLGQGGNRKGGQESQTKREGG